MSESKVTFNQYLRLVPLAIEAQSHRAGQTYYNVLDNVKPVLADRVNGHSELDPYYLDANIPAFLSFVCQHWDD